MTAGGKAAGQTVTVTVTGGPTTTVPWFDGMNAQDALERAFDAINSTERFTFAVQYYGGELGYLVVMVNETYDTYISSSHPFFYWEFLINETPADKGIDNTVLSPGDVVGFSFERYDERRHGASTLRAKYEFQQRNVASR